MVGAGTAIADQPQLTVATSRSVPSIRRRACCSTRAVGFPRPGPLFDDRRRADARGDAPTPRRRAVDAWRAAGAKVESVAASAGGTGVDLDETIAPAGREGVLQVLVEGGGALLGSVFAGAHAQRLVVLRRATRARYARARRRWGSPGPTRSPARAGTTSRRCGSSVPTSASTTRWGLMFTGIVEELGRIVDVTPNDGGARIVIEARTVLDDVELGASIAVNGCCLTVVALDEHSWSADAVIETLARTNLGDLVPGDAVNLERPVRLADRLGGHLVQGHVDATGSCPGAGPQPDGSTLVTIDAPAEVTALRRAQGLDHGRRREPHRGATPRRRVRDRVDPAHPRGHDARDPSARLPREPRSRSDRQVRRSAPRAHQTGSPMTFDEVEQRNRRRAARRVRRGRRRRGPRERGRPDHRRRPDDAREDGVHDPLHERCDLPADGGRRASTSCASR